MKTSLKTPIIFIITLLVLFLCIFVAVKLLSLNNLETDGDNETLIRAIDGDTLELNGEIIRLLCVDTPEEGKEGYEKAKAFLSLKLSEDIRIERQGFDKYNRTLAWVYSEETLVNKEIIDNKYGSIFPYNETNCSLVK